MHLGNGFGLTAIHPGVETSWHSDRISYLTDEKLVRIVMNLQGLGILQWLPYDESDLPFAWGVDTTLPHEQRNVPMRLGDVAVINGPVAHNGITLDQMRTIAVTEI